MKGLCHGQALLDTDLSVQSDFHKIHPTHNVHLVTICVVVQGPTLMLSCGLNCEMHEVSASRVLGTAKSWTYIFQPWEPRSDLSSH